MPFAIVDRAREGASGILMIVDERAEAETIAMELRQANVRVDVQPVITPNQHPLSPSTQQ
jgi:hypothetical protein